MGLFSDTIRDARRPLASDVVRRAIADEPEPAPAEDAGDDSGMHTVFRFQKAESPVMPDVFREASSRPVGEKNPLPAVDPLPAGTELFGPSASSLSVKDEQRNSDLVTGQESSRSPGKITAANALSGAESLQSVVLPGPSASGSQRESHQSKIPEGSQIPASPRGNASWSQPSGRGAPSETSLLAAGGQSSPAPRGFANRPQPATLAPAVGQAAGGANWPPPVGAAAPATATAAAPIALDLADPTDLTPPAAATHSHAAPRSAPPLAHAGATAATRTRAAPPPGDGLSARPAAGRAAPADREPRLVIGRIDVVVLAAPAASAAVPPADRGFASRNYLKRL